jgi:plastocyanin
VRSPRLIVAPLGFIALVVAATACGGGDALSHEDYFRRMSEIDRDFNERLDEEVLARDFTSKEGAAPFKTVVDAAQTQYSDLKPPNDLKDEHNEVVAAIGDFSAALDQAAERAGPDEPIFALIEDDAVSAANARVSDALCAIQDAANEKGITADVGCEDSAPEPLDPATLPPESTTEVLIEDLSFLPPHIQVSVGETVTWTHGSDPEPHTVTADDGSFGSADLEDEGDTFELAFDEGGEFLYFCEIHSDMRGLVTVTE